MLGIRIRRACGKMSHPAELLKKHLMDLNARLDRLDAKLDSSMQTVDEEVRKLGVKIDSGVQDANEKITKLDLKLDGSMQTIHGEIHKLDTDLDCGMKLASEKIDKLDAKFDGNLQTANEELRRLDAKLAGSIQMIDQNIGALYREKLAVQEFREFVDVFNKVLGENLQMSKVPVPQSSELVVQESSAMVNSGVQEEVTVIVDMESEAQENNAAASSTQAVEGVSPNTVADNPSPEMVEEVAPPRVAEETAQDVAVEEPVGKHVGFPMKVVGEAFYVGDGVTSIVGDVEIPPGTTVDETLVVKGNFRSNEFCRLLKNVKALKDVDIGVDNTVEGNVVSGGKVTVGPNCVVEGSIESDGDVEIGDNVIIKQNLSSKSSVKVSRLAHVLRDIYAAKGIFKT
jgi:hypothetical protein